MDEYRKLLTVAMPLSEASVTSLDAYITEKGLDAVIDGIIRACEKHVKRNEDPTAQSREQKIAVREWGYASRKLRTVLQDILENGPGSNDRVTKKVAKLSDDIIF
jgi:hypothetical protein